MKKSEGTLDCLLDFCRQNDAYVLTPNQRLYHTLLNQYHSQQKTDTWPTPTILTWQTWLETLWIDAELLHADPLPQLLTTHQTTLLWENVIRQTRTGLMNIPYTATLAQQAWQQIHHWQITPSATSFNYNDDSRTFYQWLKPFNHHCQQQDWITPDSMPQRVIELIRSKVINIPQTLVLVCFELITPIMRTLLNVCQQQGCQVILFSFKQALGVCQQFAATDLNHELSHMATWAQQQLNTGIQSIGCIIPNLSTQREKIEYYMQRYLNPEHYHISLGKPLAHYPMIADALAVLELTTQEISLENLAIFLASPCFTTDEQERFHRAQLLQRISTTHCLPLSLDALVRLSGDQAHSSYTPTLHAQLKKLHSLTQSNNNTSLPIWAQYFTQFLSQLNWPNQTQLDSSAWQIIQRWNKLLDEYAGLDTILPQQEVKSARNHLLALSENTTFQIQEQAKPITILGILEAAGQTFDSLWIQGMTAHEWPQPPKPNALIPLPLQIKHQLPYATTKSALMHSEQLHKRLQHSGATCIFSYAQNDTDIPIAPSVLISNMDRVTFAANKAVYQDHNHKTVLETLQDNNAPALSKVHKIKGGTNILRYQAACPFQALAKLRLQAYTHDIPQIGFTPPQRGILVHHALEILWQRLVDKNTLHHYSDAQLHELITVCINESINKLKRNSSNTVSIIRSVERKRLHRLLQQWLAYEAQRPAFTVVNTEHEISLTIANIQITTRVDRIDELTNGKKIILDYKTGRTSTTSWFSPTPEQPQLPLYSLTDPSIIAISFAQLKTGELKFNGYAAEDIGIAGIQTVIDWETQLKHWQDSFSTLLHTYCQGDATVKPIKGNTTCQTCGLYAFCRVGRSPLTNLLSE